MGKMDSHVRNFLQRVRGDFPLVKIGSQSLTNGDQLAATFKGEWLQGQPDGGYHSVSPKTAGYISYNERVSAIGRYRTPGIFLFEQDTL